MFARVTLLEIDTMRIDTDTAVDVFESEVLPDLREQPGYAGVLVLATAEGTGTIVTLLGHRRGGRRERPRPGSTPRCSRAHVTIFKSPPGRGRYEVAIAELPASTAIPAEEVVSELFGAPVDTLAVVLGVLLVVALRRRRRARLRHTVLMKLGVRNLTRRPGRSAIIVSGLMLGTMIIGSALGFGDIMANTVRSSVITTLGQTDEIVSARSGEAPDIATLGEGTAVRYLSADEADAVVAAARSIPEVDGAAPGISEAVAVQDTRSRTNEPQLALFATDPGSMSGFGEITTESGAGVGLDDLASG